MALALCACATGRPPAVAPVLPKGDVPFVVSPLDGYPLTIDRERELRIADAHTALIGRGDAAAARAVAKELLAADPGFHPALVLLAAASFVAHDAPDVVRRLSPVQAELPAYTACAMLLGRAAELVQDPALAYRAFRGAAGGSQLAAERADELLPAALGQLSTRVEDALGRNHVEDAEADLRLMRAWAPREEATEVAARAVAVARGDASAELVSVRALAQRHPEDRGLSERRADLEVQVGDPKQGMQIFETLARDEPGNRRLAEKLATARFRWRMQLLPATVREVARHAQLSRGELALLLYWLLPNVRYGQAASARIATDVLDHPYREEIVRVVNLGLLDVDETLHRFGAERAATRPEAAAAVLRVLARGGGTSCLEGTSAAAIGRDTACDLAARCGLLGAGAECLPGLPLSGTAATDLIRHAVDMLGGR